MDSNEQALRQKIISATKDLIKEIGDAEKITVRQIAERAGVGNGLINYHFKSKDNLISIAIGDVMAEAITGFMKNGDYTRMEPDVRLKALLKELCDLMGSDDKLIRFLLLREITEGNMQAPLYLIPILREIFGAQKDDMQLRLIALQILQPIQASALNAAAFHLYSGIDLKEPEQRSRYIDILVDNLTVAVSP